MRTRWLLVVSLAAALVGACGGKNNDGGDDVGPHMPQCSDGIDNDGDGKIDFPDDLGCTSAEDDTEDSLPAPACSDGRDNDGDGKIDFPDDPGCFSPMTDDETDDCPDGPNCPQCSNGKDDDGNGATDFPDDPGCTSAADTTEFTSSPLQCSNIKVLPLPASGSDSGSLDPASESDVSSPCGGGGGAAAVAYQFHLGEAKVVVATTDTGGTTADTVIDIRKADHCEQDSSELACNDDSTPDGASTGDTASTATVSLLPGDYFIIVEGRDSSQIGTYQLNVQFFAGEGASCTTDPCGPGLACHAGVCEKPRCSNGLDDDGDGKIDFPNEPGCTDAADDDETDDCPTGPNCPVCSNGSDDDHDGKTDFPDDPGCSSAAGTAESCITTEGVQIINTVDTTGDNTTASDDATLSCAFGSGGLDLTYELDLPALDSLTATVTFDFGFYDVALLPSTCRQDGTDELACTFGDDFEPAEVDMTNLAAGTYFLVVDGDDDFETGGFDINLKGVIAAHGSCESALAQAGVLECGFGFACVGTAGSRTCEPAKCSDGIDNNGDGLIDYPFDPSCSSPTDDTEEDVCPGPDCPVCFDGLDQDSDGKKDFPADFGCSSAGGTSEAFCPSETAAPIVITGPTTTGNLIAGNKNDEVIPCHIDIGSPADGFDVAFALQLPVPVKSLHVDTESSTGLDDTVIELLDTQCSTAPLACNDDGDIDFLSSFDSGALTAGNYALILQGFDSSQTGAFTLTVTGVVGAGQACTDPLFTAGLLSCDAGLTCTAGTCQ